MSFAKPLLVIFAGAIFLFTGAAAHAQATLSPERGVSYAVNGVDVIIKEVISLIRKTTVHE